MTTIRLDDELENMLETYAALENVSKSAIIKEALSEYFRNNLQTASAFELGKDLFGQTASGKTDKSQHYKKLIRKKLREKHTR